MNEKEYVNNVCKKCLNRYNNKDLCDIRKKIDENYECQNEKIKKKKTPEEIQRNKEEVKYLRKIAAERDKVNQKLDDDLRKIINSGESLSNYELWINKKTEVFIDVKYIIDIVKKDFDKEAVNIMPLNTKNLLYLIVKKEN